jgi:predicted helicase
VEKLKTAGPIPTYLVAIEKLAATGVAREHAYRPALSSLLQALLPGMTPVNEPAQVECGAPDFAILSTQVPVGHVEAKDLGIDLDKLLKGEQLQRYLAGLPNFIFTNQLDFIWFVEGEERTRVSIAGWTKTKTKAKTLSRLPHAFADLEAMFAEFGKTSTKQIKDAEKLAARLASVATLIRSAVAARLKLTKKGALHEQLEFFRKILSLNISAESFADIYAQTIAYGLFTARSFHDGSKPFSRHLAAYELPKSNPFLRSIYSQLAGPDMEPSLVWAVDHLARILDRTDMPKVLAEFESKSGKKDPVFYFYEDFLAHYDPDLKEARGVYYTPEPVVDYIVRSIDELLVTSFGLKTGFADRSTIKLDDGSESHRVIVLDPAAGTGTFLASVIDRIRETETKQGRGGTWNAYVREHLIPRIFGFELLMAPYTVCHLKLGLILEKSGFKFKDNERVGVYLTNSLEESQVLLESSPFLKALHDEGAAAGRIKSSSPVMVILGNPPYSGHSANSGEFLRCLLHGLDIVSGQDAESYFHIDGVSIGERQPKWLNDDYVKFIRFSQWKIERNGSGILAFITNHNYLSAPTFRAMRASLLNTFDDIYVLDLHGSTKRRDKAEDGGVDQNVFDIQQGVAIVIFVKRSSELSDGVNKVCYHGLRGPRSTIVGSNALGKYQWLDAHSVSNTVWQDIEPTAPYFLFVPRSKALAEEYQHGISLKSLFQNSGVGIVAGRDHFNFAFTAVCTENLNTGVVVMKSAKDGA